MQKCDWIVTKKHENIILASDICSANWTHKILEVVNSFSTHNAIFYTKFHMLTRQF